MDPTAGPSHIAIARIVRTRGNRGEVLAELHTDFPTRFSLLPRVWVAFPDGRRESLVLENCWPHQGRQVLKFGGFDSITAAEALVGAWVEVEADQAVTLPEGTYWDRDLVGCSVRSAGGEALGTVVEVMRIVRTHAPATPDTAMRSKPSQGGKYLSITVTIEAHSRDQLDAIYMELTASSLVMMAL